MASPVANAIARARSGLDWSYPCLVWAADYLRDATGVDYAADWRAVRWNEAVAKQTLSGLSEKGSGWSRVERTIDGFARRYGWREVEGPMQGAVMLGVYTDADGRGVVAIFDGQDRWVLSNDGKGVTITGIQPDRMWEIVH